MSSPCDTYRLLYFFFQAEDGIRDGHVTGVQTCALPIAMGGGGCWAADGSTFAPISTAPISTVANAAPRFLVILSSLLDVVALRGRRARDMRRAAPPLQEPPPARVRELRALLEAAR